MPRHDQTIDPSPPTPAKPADLTGALAAAMPALYVAFLDLSWKDVTDALVWTAGGLMLAIGVLMAISRAVPRTSGQIALSRTGLEIVALATWQLCYWIVPALWLVFASALLSYITFQINPPLQMSSPWMQVLPVIVLGIVVWLLPRRTIGIIICLIALIQLAVGTTIAIRFAKAHRDPTPSHFWTLDSTGGLTEYVQDSVFDQTKTIQDPHFPNDPTKRIQDPLGTLPKVDSNGDPIWVYVAVDAQGNEMKAADGSPLIVPTDAAGKLAPLPPGAAKAVPQYTSTTFETVPAGNSGPLQFVPHAVAQSPRPMSERFAAACVISTGMALALFQFIAALQYGDRRRRSKVIIVSFVLLAVVHVAGMCLVTAAQNHFLNNNVVVSPTGFSAPIGDIMQAVGAWAFGSPKAGWWFMFSQASVLLLVHVAAAWASFNLTGFWKPSHKFLQKPAIRVASATLLCAGVVVSSGERLSMAPSFSGIAALAPLHVVDLSGSALLAALAAVLTICVGACWTHVFRRVHSAVSEVAAALAMMIALLVFAAFLVGAIALRGEIGRELLTAIGIIAVAVVVSYLIGRPAHRRAQRMLKGQCVECGYDLRHSPDQCPECGSASGREAAEHAADGGDEAAKHGLGAAIEDVAPSNKNA